MTGERTTTRRAALALAAGVGRSCCSGAVRPPRPARPRPDARRRAPRVRFGRSPVRGADPSAWDLPRHGRRPPRWLLARRVRHLARPAAGRRPRRAGMDGARGRVPRVGAGGGFPATLDDVSAALDLLAGRVGDGPLVTLGHSAGGQLAVWSATRRRHERWRSARVLPTPWSPRRGCSTCAAPPRPDLGGGAVQAFLGGSPSERPEADAAADPRALVPAGVPVRCVHGTDDGTVPLSPVAGLRGRRPGGRWRRRPCSRCPATTSPRSTPAPTPGPAPSRCSRRSRATARVRASRHPGRRHRLDGTDPVWLDILTSR